MKGDKKMPARTTFEDLLRRVEEAVQRPPLEVRRTIEAFFELMPEVLAETDMPVRIRHFGQFMLSVPRRTHFGIQSRARTLKPEIIFRTTPNLKTRLAEVKPTPDRASLHPTKAEGEANEPRKHDTDDKG